MVMGRWYDKRWIGWGYRMDDGDIGRLGLVFEPRPPHSKPSVSHMIEMGIMWKPSTKDSTSESPHAKKKSEMPGVCVCVRDETILL